MCHLCISWKQKSFKYEKVLVSSDWEIFGQKSRALEEISSFSSWGVQLWKTNFYYQNGYVSKFESKRSKSLDSIAYSVFKDFDQKNYIFRATLHSKMAIDFEPHHVAYMYILKVRKCWVCVFLLLDSIEENIVSDANLNPPPPRNRVNTAHLVS